MLKSDEMALFNKISAGSDDEEDLEQLRLVALQSLKPKSTPTISKSFDVKPRKFQQNFRPTFGAAQTTRHSGKGFRNGSNRGRNGGFPRVRTNTNLISIQPVDHSETKENKSSECNSEPKKLVLPQDRYCKKPVCVEAVQDTVTNKFDRYDNSEHSDSDSDEQSVHNDSAKNERDNSVERLIYEIDSEIELINKGEKSKTKLDSPKKADDASENMHSEVVDKDPCLEVDDVVQINNEEKLLDEDEKLDGLEMNDPEEVNQSQSPKPSDSPGRIQSNKRKSESRSPKSHMYDTQRRSPYHSRRTSRSPSRKRYSPMHYSRPRSPLMFTDVLGTITRAPLSPRSAAFVLQNQEILARRKMSPRRSHSRESNKKRSLSPRRRSRSPHVYDGGKRSLSPRRRSHSPRDSPKRSSLSPRNRRSPNKYLSVNSPKPSSRSPTHKASIHKRLGSRVGSKNSSPYCERSTEKRDGLKRRRSRSLSLSLSPSPERSYQKRPLNETTGHIKSAKLSREKTRKDNAPLTKPQDEKPLNSVLEARKRKFESPLNLEYGKISLKAIKEDVGKTESEPEGSDENHYANENENYEEEVDDGCIDLNPSINDLWSDEESDSENEGRFKSKSNTQTRNVTVLPFTKLMDKPVPSTLSLNQQPKENRERKKRRTNSRRSRSPGKKLKESKSQNRDENQKHTSRDKVTSNEQDTVKQKQSVLAESEKKKEPSKDLKEKDKPKTEEPKAVEKPVRKVNIQSPEKEAPATVEPEIIIDNDESESTKEDDLRAELSRRRAQRMMKGGPLVEVPARLLKTALEDVVQKQHSKKAKGSLNSADRRVLILKRLISNPTTKSDATSKVSKAAGKLPIHMRLGVSSVVEQPPEEVVRPERRTKRSRSGRRKKASTQV